jgi:hypothetical protein
MQKYAIIIQKYYRAYKNKKILNNIYLKLPDDLQRKIVFHIREEYYYNKYKKSIINIIDNRLKVSRIDIQDQFSYNRLLKYLIKQENKKNLITNINLYKKYKKLFNFTYEISSSVGDYDHIKHMIYVITTDFENEISNHVENNIFENVWGLYMSMRIMNT